MPDPGRPFQSILFEQPGGAAQAEQSQQPSCFPDLNLDQALDWMTTGRGEYQLKPFFYTPLSDPGAVKYRHGILRDLENEPTRQTVQEFATQMRRMRETTGAGGPAALPLSAGTLVCGRGGHLLQIGRASCRERV